MRKLWKILLGVAVLSIGAAQFLNMRIENRAKSYVQNDLNALQLPIAFETVGVRANRRWNRKGAACEGFCLHALLSGTASRVLIADGEDFPDHVSGDEAATAFFLEKREICPEVEFVPGHHSLALPSYEGDLRKAAQARERIEQAMAVGTCLISEPATLGEAEVVLTRANLVRGPYYSSRLGFSFTSATETVDRLSVHVRNADAQSFDAVYRWTGVQYFKFAPALFPVIAFGYGLEFNPAWLRYEHRININSKHYERPDWPAFLTQTLALDLELN